VSTAAASSAVEIFTEDDFYVPYFRLYISRKELAVEHDVISVTYSDSLANIDSFDITVNNNDPDLALDKDRVNQSPFKYSDADTFAPWQEAELYMGYVRKGNTYSRRMLLGEIVTMTPNFPASGGSTLTVRALNLLHRFRTKQETRPFRMLYDSEIARLIVKAIADDVRKRVPQVDLHVDEEEITANLKRGNEVMHDYLVMSNQYPINFLLQRARALGYDVSLSEKRTQVSEKKEKRDVTLHFGPGTHVRDITYKLRWGETLVSFQPTLQTAHQVASVLVRGWDVQGKKKIEESFTRAELQDVVQPIDLDLAESPLAQRLEVNADDPVRNKAEAKSLARARLLSITQDLVEAKGRTVGLPDLRSGSKVEITRLGKRFSGVYLVTSTTHQIGEGGYTTDFTARLESRLEEPKAG
jgi:phage protein D